MRKRPLAVGSGLPAAAAAAFVLTDRVATHFVAHGDGDLCPTKSIKASATSCYAAFASPKALDAWFGPKHDVDLRDGGHWRNSDGNRATIKKVNAGKNIRLIAEDAGLTLPTPVEIKFEAKGDKCTVMVSIERLQTRAEADGYRRAWGESLERLKAHLEAAN